MSSDQPTTETSTVLIVDDNQPLADGFAEILSTNYEVETAYTAEQARRSFREGIDVVLLDRCLPDASGDDLLSEIRDAGYDCRVAVVSATQPTSDLDCDTYLTKPLADPDTVQETVANLLGDDVSY